MKQLENNKICKYCFGCNRLFEESFEGLTNCRKFIQAKDMSEYYKSLKGEAKEK